MATDSDEYVSSRITGDPVVIAANLIDASRTWFSNVDRSGLGSFASDAELLIVVQAINDLQHHGYEYETETHTKVLNIFTRMINDRRDELGGAKLQGGFTAEVYLWWDIYGKPDINEAISYLTLDDSVTARIAFLKDVLTLTKGNPTWLPYVEAGVMDATVILNSIANNIDPNLAAEVN